MTIDPRHLVEAIRSAVDDSACAAIAIEHDLEPTTGSGSSVAPPTYPGASGPEFPYSEAGTIPVSSRTGSDPWLLDVVRDEDGRPVVAPCVILDDVQSQSGRAETALWNHRHELGGLPGFEVRGDDGTSGITPGDPTPEGVVRDAYVSSWTAGHRHVDSWIQTAAIEPGGKPVWKDADGIGGLLRSMNANVDAATLFAYAPNSALYGFWLSSDVARAHKQARAYACRVVGYGARPVHSAASKVDAFPTAKASMVDREEFGFAEVKKSKSASGKRQDRPSNLGFGSVPGSVKVTGYTCERIAARGAISLAALRTIRYATPEAASAATVALAVLGLAGDALARRDGFLRSGCDLVATASRYGFRKHGQIVPEQLDIAPSAGVAYWKEVLATALEECRAAGLDWKDPVQLYVSEPQHKLITEGADANRTGEVDT